MPELSLVIIPFVLFLILVGMIIAWILDYVHGSDGRG